MSNFPFGFQPPDDSQPGGSGQDPFQIGDLGAALSQLGAMLQGMGTNPSQGPVNWNAARDLARQVIASQGDPVVSDAQRRAVEESVRLAELWVSAATTLPASGTGARAWSRTEWLLATLPAWQQIIDPIAEQVQGSMSGLLPDTADLSQGLPEELRAMLPAEIPPELTQMLAPLMGMAKQLGASMFSMQAGQGLAALAGEVLGAGDVGLPLTPDGVPTLIPENVAAFAAGLEIEPADIQLYLALREVAHQRLLAQVVWLGPTLTGAVAEYARGIGLDASAMERALEGVDMSNPAAIQEILSSGVLVPEDTPQQKAALARLETLLALVEGWVDHVVTAAVGDRLTSAARLQEAVRRRRAAGGPAEKTFANLVGLELRPRRLREAAALWAELERVRGIEGRDAVWEHPDLLPGPGDLDDPAGFVSGSSITDADLNALTAAVESVGEATAASEGTDSEAAGASDADAPSVDAGPDAGAQAPEEDGPDQPRA